MTNSIVRVKVWVQAEYDLPPLSGETEENMIALERAYLNDELQRGELFPLAASIRWGLDVLPKEKK